jgi:hypothetical protein
LHGDANGAERIIDYVDRPVLRQPNSGAGRPDRSNPICEDMFVDPAAAHRVEHQAMTPAPTNERASSTARVSSVEAKVQSLDANKASDTPRR